MPDSIRHPSIRRSAAVSLLTAGLLSVAGGSIPIPVTAQQPVPTPVRLVVDTLHGTPVPDPYRWLEDLSAPVVRAWFLAQGAASRAALDALPGHAALLQRMRQIGAVAPPQISLPRQAGNRWFCTVRRAGDIPEFGSVESEEGFRGLLAMSTYHHVRRGTDYPAALLSIGLSDIRVAPWHSGKTIAALQAASTARPALLRVEETGGHVSGAVPADTRRLLQADQFAFLMAAAGLPPYRAPPNERD